MKKHHEKGSEQKRALLTICLQLAEKDDYRLITREQIAQQSGVSPGLISWYFGAMVRLRTEIVQYAIATDNAEVIAQAVTAGHPLVKDYTLNLEGPR